MSVKENNMYVFVIVKQCLSVIVKEKAEEKGRKTVKQKIIWKTINRYIYEFINKIKGNRKYGSFLNHCQFPIL